MLDVRRMRVLRSVVTSGSISAAAANLGYTPSAVSQQIATLEREVGVPLLEREGRGVRPTNAGTLLSDHAGEIMARLAEAETALDDLRAGRTGRLRVRFFATAGAALVPPAVATFRAKHPSIQLDLGVGEPKDPMEEVLAGRADLALSVITPHTTVPDSITVLPLLDDPYRALLPKGHRLARRRTVDLAELADDPWIDPEWPDKGPCHRVMMDACAAAGFCPNFVVTADNYPTGQGFVAAGLGVTMIPALALSGRHPGVAVRKLANPEPVRRICAVVMHGAERQPLLADLLDALGDAATAG